MAGYTYSFDLDTFTDGNHQIEIYDSAGRFLRGVLKAKGTGETTSTTYSSDFSAGVDSWQNYSNTSVAGNIDGIGGQDDTLRATVNTVDGGHNFGRPATIVAGSRSTVSFKAYIPSSNSVATGLYLGGANWPVDGPVSVTANTWETKSQTGTFPSAIARIGLASATSWNFQDVGGDDVAYFKDIVVAQLVTPSTTGATIVSAKGGTTYNFNHKNASFTYNAASYYVIIKKIN